MYYTLTYDTTLTAGTGLPGLDDQQEPRLVTVDPRALQPSDVPALEDYTAADFVLNRTPAPVRIARLTPTGPVTPQMWWDGEDGETPHAYYVQAPGWTVQAIDSLAGLLGPHAAHLTTAVHDAAWLDGLDGESPYDEDPHRAAYDKAINAMWERHGTAGVYGMQWATEHALNVRGADGWWWAQGCGSCTTGAEITALAARDLIDTVPGWTTRAYEALTAPWWAAFGHGIHPDDLPPGELVA